MNKHGDPRISQKHSDPEQEVSSFLGRFLLTFAILVLASFGLAYLIGVGTFNVGGVAFTFLLTLALCVALVILGAKALSATGE
jgi:hypothetical protein